MQRRILLGFLLGVCGVVLFGATLPFTRLALASFNPWFITFGRATLAGMLALALILALRRPWPLSSPKTLRDLAVAGFCLVLVFPLCIAVATQTVPAAHGGVVLGLLPLFTALAAVLFAGERPSLSLFVASFAGAGLVIAFALRNGAGGGFGFGDGLLVLGVIICSVGYAISARLSRTMSGWEVMSFTLILWMPVMLVGSILTAPGAPLDIGWPAWGALFYLGAFSQLVGFFFWNAGLAMGGVARVGQAQLLQPFVTVGLAWPVNGEVPDVETLLFALGVVLVVAFAQRTRARPAAAAGARTPEAVPPG